MRFFIITLSLCFISSLRAQKIGGSVLDQKTLLPISGALVYLAQDSVSEVTDEQGKFYFEGLTPGLYTVVVSHLGYFTAIQKEVWSRPGSVTTLIFNLEQSAISLDEVQIKSGLGWEPLSSRTITEEQINRLAATYYDPARLVLASPDVALTNDQNNRISVRGISPDYNTWRLEGAEIVNPNHLSNAGTLNDQPTGTGGGVNILSAQMLSRSSFQYGGMGSSMGNSVGGIFDMYLRTGQTENRRHVAQASFIGFDLGTEGALKEGGKASYLFNYRYSFTGLLTNLGVDFGGESIGFQDLSFVANFPTINQGSFKVFASGGSSFNSFAHLPFDESERQKDRQDIDFEGKMGLTGFSFSNGKLQTSVVASGFQNERQQINYNAQDQPDTSINSSLNNSLISVNISSLNRIGRHSMKTGIMTNFYQFGTQKMNLVRAYQENSYLIGKSLRFDYGLAVLLGDFKESAVDARLALRYSPTPKNEWSISYGSYHQLLNETNRLFEVPIPSSDPLPENDQRFINSKRAIISYSRYFNNARLGVEVFDYFFPDVQYLVYPLNSGAQVRNAQAFSSGLSIKFDRDFAFGWYLNTGVSVMDAGLDINQYSIFRDYALNLTFNTKYNLNMAIGKTIKLMTKNGTSKLNTNLRWMQQGPPSNYPQIISPSALTVIPPQLNHYMRMDLRIQYVKEGYRNSSWALDIQNVLNRQNEAFIYYDSFLDSRQTSYHLGLIPILTYRVEF